MLLILCLVAVTAAVLTFVFQQPQPDALERQAERQLVKPLCGALVVPEGSPLVCQVESRLCRRRQELAFDIVTLGEQPGGRGLLARACASELQGPLPPHIRLELLGSGRPLASIATGDLYEMRSGAFSLVQGLPEVPEARPGPGLGAAARAEAFATLHRRGTAFVVVRMQKDVLTFRPRPGSEFCHHQIEVLNEKGQVVASTVPGDAAHPETYKVSIGPETDAGLVLLGLMMIDKTRPPPPEPDCLRCSGAALWQLPGCGPAHGSRSP